MANIGRQPTAIDLLEQAATRGSYGDHLFFDKRDGVIRLVGDDTVLVEATDDTAKINLRQVDSKTAPYVNRFLAHSNQRVEKYWRTQLYRILPVAGKAATASIGELTAAPRIPLEGGEIVFSADFCAASQSFSPKLLTPSTSHTLPSPRQVASRSSRSTSRSRSRSSQQPGVGLAAPPSRPRKAI